MEQFIQLSPAKTPSTRTPQPQESVLPLYCSSSAREAIHHHHTGVGYYTTTVARTSINLVSLCVASLSSSSARSQRARAQIGRRERLRAHPSVQTLRVCRNPTSDNFLIRPFATVLLFRNEDITTDAAVLLPFAIFCGCNPVVVNIGFPCIHRATMGDAVVCRQGQLHPMSYTPSIPKYKYFQRFQYRLHKEQNE